MIPGERSVARALIKADDFLSSWSDGYRSVFGSGDVSPCTPTDLYRLRHAAEEKYQGQDQVHRRILVMEEINRLFTDYKDGKIQEDVRVRRLGAIVASTLGILLSSELSIALALSSGNNVIPLGIGLLGTMASLKYAQHEWKAANSPAEAISDRIRDLKIAILQ